MPNDPRFDGLCERLEVVEQIVVGAGVRDERHSHRYRINTLESWKREIDEERAGIQKQREEDQKYYGRLKKILLTALTGMVVSAAALIGDGLKKLVSPKPPVPAATTQSKTGD